MPAEADLLCDYYISSNLKGAKKSNNNNSAGTSSNLLKLNSKLSDSMSSLSSFSSTTSSLVETIDFVKYEKNPMEFLKSKYPVLNNSAKIENGHLATKSEQKLNQTVSKSIETSNSTGLETNWSKIKKNGVGLLNLGNNCYLNATLQCLAYTPPLSQWLVTKPHSTSCRFKQMKGFCSLCEVEKIIYDIFNSCNGCAKPNTLCFNIKKISNVFGVGRQEDASEFFTTLLESMNKTINFVNNSTLSNKHVYNNKNNNRNSINKPRSFLDEIFSFQFRSRVTCSNCGRLSDTIENTNTWPVDVKYVKDLQKGMLHFLREEVLDGENAYKCDKCNKKTRATKKYSIRTAPNVLVVHLKRFDFSHAGKLSHFVTYPETLSLKTLVPDTTTIQSVTTDNKALRNVAYKLYGVLVHLGYTSRSGHYYSYVRGPNNSWYKADDSRISTVQEKDALGQNAYILFYKRINQGLKTTPIENSLLRQQQIIETKPIIQQTRTIIEKPADTIKEPAIKTIETINGHNNMPSNAHNDLNDKILKKERLIAKWTKKLKKKELKRLKKKLLRLANKKVDKPSEDVNNTKIENKAEKIFLNKKRELRLMKKMIGKRKIKRLNVKIESLEQQPELETKTKEEESMIPATSAKKNESFTELINGNDTILKKESDIKVFNLSELTNGSKTTLKTWNNEESLLLKNGKNKFDSMSEEELDDYNNEFDKPKIRKKTLKKNGFHKMMHQENGSWKNKPLKHAHKLKII